MNEPRPQQVRCVANVDMIGLKYTKSINRRHSMDGPTVSIAASGKHHRAFKIVALCVCIAAVSSGLIGLSAGYHRVDPACFLAAATCYFANSLCPHRWFQIVAVVLSMAAISAFYVGLK